MRADYPPEGFCSPWPQSGRCSRATAARLRHDLPAGQEGHLWGRRQVAIPVSAVPSTSDGIQVRISKQEVQDLPPVDADHPGASTGS
jgi:hypothetical protein